MQLGTETIALSFSISPKYIFSESAEEIFLSSGMKKTFISRASAPESAILRAKSIQPFDERAVYTGYYRNFQSFCGFFIRVKIFIYRVGPGINLI